jgi:hypothetical protein
MFCKFFLSGKRLKAKRRPLAGCGFARNQDTIGGGLAPFKYPLA